MGQKVNPIGIRLGITRDWSSKWYADQRTFPHYIAMDYKIREFLKKKLKEASVSKILIERPARKAHITIHTARPGVVIVKVKADRRESTGTVRAVRTALTFWPATYQNGAATTYIAAQVCGLR